MRKVPLLLGVAGVLLSVMAFPVISFMTGYLCFDSCPSQGLGDAAATVTAVPLLPTLIVAFIAWGDCLTRAYRSQARRARIAAWAALPALAPLILVLLLVEVGLSLLPHTETTLIGPWHTFQISLIVLLCAWFVAVARYSTWLAAHTSAPAAAPLPVKRR